MKQQNNRFLNLSTWASANLSYKNLNLTSDDISDAGNRKYYRLNHKKILAVDSPPGTERNEAFIKIAQLLSSYKVKVPNIYHTHLVDGFLLIEDLGDQLLINETNQNNVLQNYKNTIDILTKFRKIDSSSLPSYNKKKIKDELNLMPKWFLTKYLNIDLDIKEITLIEKINKILTQNALDQPTSFVHRDFHSKNLICIPSEIAVIDFQDAVNGPFMYDIVSLIKDCYTDLPNQHCSQLLNYFINKNNLLKHYSLSSCIKWFDWIGLQRHLKCLGIFSRLKIKYNKKNYLSFIPRTFNYILHVCKQYDELQEFYAWLEKKIKPMINSKFQLTNLNKK